MIGRSAKHARVSAPQARVHSPSVRHEIEPHADAHSRCAHDPHSDHNSALQRCFCVSIRGHANVCDGRCQDRPNVQPLPITNARLVSIGCVDIHLTVDCTRTHAVYVHTRFRSEAKRAKACSPTSVGVNFSILSQSLSHDSGCWPRESPAAVATRRGVGVRHRPFTAARWPNTRHWSWSAEVK